MRSALGVLVVGALLGGCATGERPVLDSRRATTTTTEAAEDAAPADGLPLVFDGPPRGLLTPTGVVVPVLDESEFGYLIQTPCGLETTVVWGTPIGEVQIVLDPGHGGEEVGAVGPNGLTEADLNLRLSIRLARELERLGYTVALTRTSDYRIPIPSRTQLADALGADVLVSIHHNGPNANPSDEPGTEVYVAIGDDESARLGGLLHAEIVAALDDYEIDWSAASDAGVLEVANSEGTDAYGIVRRATVPVALVELGYLSNGPEAELFATDEYLADAAFALVDGLDAWFSDAESTGTGLGEGRTFDPGGTGGFAGCEDPPLR